MRTSVLEIIQIKFCTERQPQQQRQQQNLQNNSNGSTNKKFSLSLSTKLNYTHIQYNNPSKITSSNYIFLIDFNVQKHFSSRPHTPISRRNKMTITKLFFCPATRPSSKFAFLYIGVHLRQFRVHLFLRVFFPCLLIVFVWFCWLVYLFDLVVHSRF